MLRSCKSLRLSIQGFKLWFLFFFVCYHCHVSAQPTLIHAGGTEQYKVTSLTHPVAFPHERAGLSTWKCLFCGWCGHVQLQTPLQPPRVSALPDLLVQLLSNSSKKPAWKAVDLVFLENMVLREDVGDLKCLRVCKDKEQIKKKQNKQFNGDGAAAPARRGCGRTSILSRCTRWFLTTEGHKNLTAEYWKIILLKVGNVLLAVNI